MISKNKILLTVLALCLIQTSFAACEKKAPVRKPFQEADNLVCPPKTERVEDKSSSYPKFFCMGFDGREGPFLEFDPNGRLRVKANYHDDELDGIWTSYHPRGTVDTSGPMDNGKRNGVWSQRFTNGNLRSEKTYDMDTLSGPLKLYYNTGALMAEGTNKDGYEYGPWKVYTPDGKLARECNMVHGKEENCIIHIKDFQVSSKFYNAGDKGAL